ncbi:MAG: glyoxalase [Halobacteriovoraceae bacterium]|nr:glyoxalase [Halobacteriovoraceae bacterium]
MQKAHFIFYVKDQERSSNFYKSVFSTEPTLNVPGMTEFTLNDGCILGLMPEHGIKKLLGDVISYPSLANGMPRSELYLIVDNPGDYHQKAIKTGAKELSPLMQRDWGDTAAYSADPDGHILAFASRKIKKQP